MIETTTDVHRYGILVTIRTKNGATISQVVPERDVEATKAELEAIAAAFVGKLVER